MLGVCAFSVWVVKLVCDLCVLVFVGYLVVCLSLVLILYGLADYGLWVCDKWL